GRKTTARLVVGGRAQGLRPRRRAAAGGSEGADVAPPGPCPAAGTQSRAGGVAGRCRRPARIGAARTRRRRAWYGTKLGLQLSYSYGIITVRIMPRPRTSMSAIQRPEQSAQLERRAQRFRELKRGLDQLEYFCKGTVLKRMMKCGKAGCACAADPDK